MEISPLETLIFVKNVIMFNFIRNLFGFNDNSNIIKGELTIDNRNEIISDLNNSDLVEKVVLSRSHCSDDLALYITFKKPIKIVDETTNDNRRDKTAIVLEDESFEFYPSRKFFKITA